MMSGMEFYLSLLASYYLGVLLTLTSFYFSDIFEEAKDD